MEPQFQVGDIVRRGHQGKLMYEVVAVISTGRTITYDLISEKGKRSQGVSEYRLHQYIR